MTTCIGCMVKTRSKVTLHHPDPALEPSVYEMIETDQKKLLSWRRTQHMEQKNRRKQCDACALINAIN